MAYHLTNVEVENKVAFLVQLNTLLTQVSSVVKNNALSNAQKARLGDIRTMTDTWLKDVVTIGSPRPSITPGDPPSRSSVTQAPAQPSATSPAAGAATAASPSEPPSPAAAEAEAATEGTNSALKNTSASTNAEQACELAIPAGSVPLAPTTTTPSESAAAEALGSSSSFAAGIASRPSALDGRILVSLVSYLRLLFDNDVPERTRLQAFGRNLARLLVVRCCSTIMASLQHVVHQTYAVREAEPAATPTGSAVTANVDCPMEELAEGSPENRGHPSVSAVDVRDQVQVPVADKAKIFVDLAREINVATKALLGCVQLMTSNAVPSDSASARFPMQLCVDVMKQTRRALVYFQSRIEKEELYVLRMHVFAEKAAANDAAALPSAEDVDAVQEVLQQQPAEDLAAHVRRRAKALEALWGPSLTHSIRHIGDVIDPAVTFIVAVAGVRAEGAPAAMGSLKKDAADDLFSLYSVSSPSATSVPSGGASRPSSAVAAGSSPAASGGLARPSSNKQLLNLTMANGSTGAAGHVASPVSVGSMTPPAWRAAAGEVLIGLGSSYTADYLAAVARRCGDDNEGQLLSTRLLANMLDFVIAHDVPLLQWVMRLNRWSTALYEGILNCVMSIQPGVLVVGLDTLRRLTMHCPMELGQEVGYLYSNVVLRQLESSNSPHYVKRIIVQHLLTTCTSPSSIVPAGMAAEGEREVPLLLHLYRLYDLGVHAHQLNFVQQLTNSLSRIVRAAPKEDFTQDAVVQEQLQRQQEATISIASTQVAAAAAAEPKKQSEAEHSAASDGPNLDISTPAATATGSTANVQASVATSPTSLAASLASLSLPAMALHGLVRIVELLTTQAPPEEESGRDVLANLPLVQNREWKLKEQQQVDLFNASPKKAVYKRFNVTAEEDALPGAHSAFARQWDHTLLPPVASAETARKVSAVVDFLTSISSLDPGAVSDFLTSPALFPLHVCAAYLRRLPLAGRSVLEAVGELLMRVQLPKEGQRIERLLEYFSAAYFDANNVQGVDRQVFPFKNDTAVFIVVVATVMLNTNIHNPSVGMRLDLEAFRAQLRDCNDNESFADAFVDEIFFSISTHPLESVKPVKIESNANVDSASRGAFDMLFFTQEEKRQLAFGVERQRMVSETRQLLHLRTQQEPRQPLPPEWWCAAAKDLFLSTWSAVCAVFGPAMYEGTSAPMPVLRQCVRGLQALLCMAAAFDLQTECTVTLLTLLRMAESTSAREHCRRAVLVVAATSYAVHFPVRCWVAVCQLMLELRLSPMSAAPPLVEDVFTRMESLTRLSLEAEETRAAAAAAEVEGGAAQASTVVAVDKPTEAIHRVLEGVMATIGGYVVGDVANMSAALLLLRRALEFSRIVHGRHAPEVVYFVNIRDFTALVMPEYVELIKKHSASDEGLQVLLGCLVDILCTMWLSYSTHRVAAPASVLGESSDRSCIDGRVGEEGRGKRKVPETIIVDTAPAGFARCFRCLRSIYDITLTATASDGSATLLQMHVLQAVKEVLARTAQATEVMAGAHHLSLHTMVTAWQQALYPLGMALCDRRTTTTEAGSLALLVLRKLVAISGGTGGTFSERLPPQVRAALLWLLAQLAYMGCMCGDTDGAQVCVALLSSICTATLAMPPSAPPPGAWCAAGSTSPPSAISDADIGTFTRALAERDVLTQQVVSSIEENPEYMAQQTVARLGLLLRCEREQTRAEVVHQLRTLSLQMRPAQAQTSAIDLAEVVLEGAIGHAAHHHKTSITHTSLIPFFFFQVPVPVSMRRCSRSAFRATLPAALGFLATDLLPCLSGEHLVVTAKILMQRCLMPIFLSPNSPYQSRLLAVRSLSQCITVCLPQNGETPRPQLAQCVMDCLSLCLYALQIPLHFIVPPTATFIGRRWLDAPPAAAVEEWRAYDAAAAQVIRVMDTADPAWVVRGTQPPASTPPTGGEDSSVVAPPSRSNKANGSSGASAALLRDEPLIECVNLFAQVLAGVPKEVYSVVTSAMTQTAGGEAMSEEPAAAGAAPAEWTLPHTSVLVLLQLTLKTSGILFAILWRINHPHMVEQYTHQLVELGREAPALIRNGGLLPHAAIRSVLQCYLELAMLSVEYPTTEVLASTTDLIEGTRQMQIATQPSLANAPSPSTGAYGGDATVLDSTSSLAVDAASLQRLSPQEQQHVRTCNSGMYQQLSAVLSYLVKLLTETSNAATTPTTSVPGWEHRKKAFEAMAMHPRFFSSLVSLLAPTAGILIVTVRDYFAWYIAHAELLRTAPIHPAQAPMEHMSESEPMNGTAPSNSHSNGHKARAPAHMPMAAERAALKEVQVEEAYVGDENSLL
ncbi:hypothetical protein ABL78_2422 [Leptomonas seymouri]|uniref:SEC7 domain-containing protein n=1 Tax=Leptomonas seymouri TaxID=5684 RepID=A0A0N1I7J0_LEPSE|nr:hypothetical protein ABL78_2422 [Leptomonas seymouri]|eukprot:KPI88460.1 hypothetical protein ABL78_2422 [Leptomonas seymouri]